MAGRETPATRALGKRVAPAAPERAEKVTGYVTGGISPFGQRRPLPTVVDELVEALDTVWVSAGHRGLEIGPAPADLVRLLAAEVRPIARRPHATAVAGGHRRGEAANGGRPGRWGQHHPI